MSSGQAAIISSTAESIHTSETLSTLPILDQQKENEPSQADEAVLLPFVQEDMPALVAIETDSVQMTGPIPQQHSTDPPLDKFLTPARQAEALLSDRWQPQQNNLLRSTGDQQDSGVFSLEPKEDNQEALLPQEPFYVNSTSVQPECTELLSSEMTAPSLVPSLPAVSDIAHSTDYVEMAEPLESSARADEESVTGPPQTDQALSATSTVKVASRGLDSAMTGLVIWPYKLVAKSVNRAVDYGAKPVVDYVVKPIGSWTWKKGTEVTRSIWQSRLFSWKKPGEAPNQPDSGSGPGTERLLAAPASEPELDTSTESSIPEVTLQEVEVADESLAGDSMPVD